MWNRLNRVKAPVGKVLTLSEAKKQCRVEHDDDDEYLDGLIATATGFVDGPTGIGVALLTQQWVMSLDNWPNRAIVVPLGPVQTIDQITYVDPSGTVQVLDPSMYIADFDTQPLNIARAFGIAWPPPRYQLGAIKVTFTAGYDVAGDYNNPVPYDIRHAIKLILSHLYENRDAVVGIASRDSPSEIPLGATSILERYRAGRIA